MGKLETLIRVRVEQRERINALAERLGVRSVDLLRVAVALGITQLEQLADDPKEVRRILDAIQKGREVAD